MGSLITGFYRDCSLNAAERLEIHFEDMSIPISIKELNEWTKDQSGSNSELATWLSLLGFESRESLSTFLQETFSKDKDMALELLQSWYGRKMFEEVVELFHLDKQESGEEIFNHLVQFLQSKNEDTVLDFIKHLPAEVIHVDLDGMVKVANILRKELKRKQKLVSDLEQISLTSESHSLELITENQIQESIFESIIFEVPHRSKPISLELWRPSLDAMQRSSLIVLMPGLGGDINHFRWLARSLSHNGWSVVVLQHPGSDSSSVKALLDGRLPAPGLEVIPDRLEDLRAVLNGIENGSIKAPGENLILMGHSLGALTAFIAAGAAPHATLNENCSESGDDFFLTNLSELLQCQLVDVSLPIQKEIPNLSAIVGINSFGSLVWPRSSTEKISVPVFLTGGTFDLVTPALSEQLGLLLSTKTNNLSRVLLIDGASHFSPIRVRDSVDKKISDDVFKLDQSLVGIHPLSVQSVLAKEIIRFLANFEKGEIISPSTNLVRNDVKFHILDRKIIKKLLRN